MDITGKKANPAVSFSCLRGIRCVVCVTRIAVFLLVGNCIPVKNDLLCDGKINKICIY